MKKTYLALVRHGQSLWNQKGLFTGWRDVGLTAQGREEARKTGALLKRKGIVFERAYASMLKRSIDTLRLILEEMGLAGGPVAQSWRLNERHYGALQGMRKTAAAEKYGAHQVMQWRRAFKSAPPPLEEAPPEPAWPGAPRLRSESLEDVQKRLLPFWKKEALPVVERGESVLIAAHGNSLRALIKHIEGISDEDIFHVNIQTGQAVIYLVRQGRFSREKA